METGTTPFIRIAESRSDQLISDQAPTLEIAGLTKDLRRLLEAVEVEAMLRDARAIVLGADEGARGFYDRMGYRGKHAMRMKELPLLGAVRTRRAQALAEQLGDLDRGVVVERVGLP